MSNKMKLVLLTIVLMLTIIALMFVNIDVNLWFSVLVSNLVPICIFTMAIGVMRNPNTMKLIKANVQYTFALAVVVIASPIMFLAYGLPLDRDIPIMINKSYSEVNGVVTNVDIINANKNRSEKLTVKDNISNEQVSFNFSRGSLNDIKNGDTIKIKYLPHSHKVMYRSK